MQQYIWILCLCLFIFSSCENVEEEIIEQEIITKKRLEKITKTSLIILGNVQDAGYPQIGCMKACCREHWSPAAQKKSITCLGLVDPTSNQTWLFEASPDFKHQTKKLSDYVNQDVFQLPNGIFLTHGHIGHYVGLMHLGREAMGADRVPVYAMPRMKNYLETSGPWSQLVALNNIDLQLLAADSSILLTPTLKVTPFLVPHRGEYTETVGYKIEGENQRVLFIPDIDKWDQWEKNIKEEIAKVDLAFLDATFFKNGEVGNRDMSEIPHPFVEESMKLFADLPETEKAKIHFIHFNHTNPAIKDSHPLKDSLQNLGFQFPKEGSLFEM